MWLWEVGTGKERSFAVPAVPGSRVFSAAFSPDGRTLARGDTDGTVWLDEVASGQVRRRLSGHWGTVDSLAFTPDGRTLASGSKDTTVLLWDVRPPAGPASPAESLWAGLAAADAAAAWRAAGTLAASPEKAVALLVGKLQPVPAPDAGRVARLIAGLSAETFAERSKAEEALAGLGELAEPALWKASEGDPSAETRRRAAQLLDQLEGAARSPDRLRQTRALEVLEHLGTPAARDLLRDLARGAAEASLTREARASLARLERRRK